MKNETNLNDLERFNGADVLKIMEMIKKQNTNFDRITASPEALAKWLESHLNYCDCDEADLSRNNFDCSSCPYCKDDICFDDKEKWLIWLNEESEE